MQDPSPENYSFYETPPDDFYDPEFNGDNKPPETPVEKILSLLNGIMKNPSKAILFSLLIIILILGYRIMTKSPNATNDNLVIATNEKAVVLKDSFHSDLQIKPSLEDNLNPGLVEEVIDGQEVMNMVEEEQEQESLKTNTPISTFQVSGNPTAGELLKFKIQNYDTNLDYYLDLGNGERMKAVRQSSYRYLMPGIYRIRLTISDKKGGAEYYSQYVNIRTPEPEETIVRTTSPTNPTKDNPVGKDSMSGQLIAQEKNKLPEKDSVPFPKETDTLYAFNSEEAIPVIKNDSPLIEKNKAKPLPKPIEAPLSYAEKMPSYPGGNSALKQFLKDAIQYPQMALENEVEGKVYVRFIVNPDGTIESPTVVKGIGFGCDEEALKVISRMPGWIPGEQGGFKVQVIKTLPINFRLK